MLGDIRRTLEGILRSLQGPYVTKIEGVAGIGTAAAYASGDAFGSKFYFTVPKRGTIATVVFLDTDDEGIEKDVVFLSGEFTATADNAAFSLGDADLPNVVGVVNIASTDFTDLGANRIGQATPALGYYAPQGKLWCQLITRGADNIAAGQQPRMFLVIE